ncbi:hypothetical protein BT69DRAFT_518363 [Atractiella rhizophila]|nr:hypothetical protein BT69DRAFT_518363 [Atractiella rhizophila]
MQRCRAGYLFGRTEEDARSLIDESEPSYDGEYLPTLRSSRYVRMQRKLLEYEQAQSPGSAPPTLIDYLKPHIQDYVDMWLGGPQNPEFDLEVEISYREIDKKVQEDEDHQPPPAPEPTPVLSGDANAPLQPQSAESLASARFESERLVFRAAGEKEIDRSLSPLVRQECDVRTLKANPSVETQSASNVAAPRVHANHSSTGEGEEVGVKRGHDGRPSSKKRWMSDDSLKIRKQGGAVITVNDLGMQVLPTTVVVDTKKKRKRDEEVDGVSSKRVRRPPIWP